MVNRPLAWKTGFPFLPLLLFTGVAFGQADAKNGSGIAKRLEPAKLVVVERGTGRPVTKFRFHYGVETASGEGARERNEIWQDVSSDSGTVTLPGVPATARVSVTILAPGYMSYYDAEIYESFKLASDTSDRKLRMELTPAVRLRGVVQDRETGKPVAGAEVMPIAQWGPPLFDRGTQPSRAVATDARGRFALDLPKGRKFVIQHPAYLDSHWHKVDRAEYDGTDVWQLTPQLRRPVSGVVVAAKTGEALAGVRVVGPAGTEVKTDNRGRFRIEAIWDAKLTFLMSGRVSKTHQVDSESPESLRIEMWPSRRFAVRLSDSLGRPVPEYDLTIGAGRAPVSYMCSDYQVRSADGCRSIALGEKAHEQHAWAHSRFEKQRDELSELWIAVRTPDHAVAETWIDLDNLPEVVELRLQPGKVVVGRIDQGDVPLEDASVQLEPMMPRPIENTFGGPVQSERQEFFNRKVTPAADGSFRFANIRPGHVYLAKINVGPLRFQRLVPVSEAPSPTAVPPVRLPECGTITGQIFHPPEWSSDRGAADGDQERDPPKPRPWEFVSGNVSASNRAYDQYGPRPISFTTDRQGRFTVKNVPAGRVTVSVNLVTADLVGGHSSNVWVLPGQVSEVRMFDPSGDWDWPLEVRVGSGSFEAYLAGRGSDYGQYKLPKESIEYLAREGAGVDVHLSPAGDQPVSSGKDVLHLCESTSPATTPGFKMYRMCDVSPGRWRLTVDLGWKRRGTPLFEKEIDVRPGMQPIVVPLSPCSITGTVQDPTEELSLGTLFTTTTAQRPELVRRETCATDEREFVVPFHPPGQFDVVIHAEDRWCRREGVQVKPNQLTKLDMPAWRSGGAIRVRYTLDRPLPADPAQQEVQVTLVAVDSCGRRLDFPDGDISAFDGTTSLPYTLGGLWPDEWTVELRSNGEQIGRAHVTVSGTETTTCQIDVE